MSKRRIFIGDVHGCFEELQLILEKAKWDKKTDQLCFVGDLINRGPFSFEVLQFAKNYATMCVRGNHEENFLDYLNQKKSHKPLYEELIKKLGTSLKIYVRWLEKLPYFIEEKEFILVHAGLTPGKTVQESRKEDLIRIRTWDGIGENTNVRTNPPWYQFYEGEKLVIYGHYAIEGLKIRENTIGLDSGCVWGKELSAMIMAEGKRDIIQVKAKKPYSVIPD
jgi:serine/threonine protein phosphatase 1